MNFHVIKRYALFSEAKAQFCCICLAVSRQVSVLRVVVLLLRQIIIPPVPLEIYQVSCEQPKHYLLTRRNKVLFIMLIQAFQQKLRISVAWEHYS